MLSDGDLKTAVARGLIDEAQRQALLALARQSASDDTAAAADAENFRFLRSFDDIFLSVGEVLLIIGVIGASAAAGEVVLWLGAAGMWGLAEFVAARRRRTVPSMILAIAFVGFTAYLVGTAVTGMAPREVEMRVLRAGGGVAPYAVVAFLAGLAFYARFRLPFALLLVAASAAAAVAGIIIPSLEPGHVHWLLLALGVAVFAVAMYYDSRDPTRITRLSDCAFWLHVAAAPMIVHGVLAMSPRAAGSEDPATTLLVVAVFVVLGVVALTIDRRALLVSGLAYLAAALSQLVSIGVGSLTTDSASIVASLTALLLGAMVIAMSTGWRSLRAVLVGGTPLRRLVPWIPAVRGAPSDVNDAPAG